MAALHVRSGTLRVALDLHCPGISGPGNETIHLVGSPLDRIAGEQRLFSGILESMADGCLPFSAGDFLPFGVAWNVAGSYAEGQGFGPWCAGFPGVRLASSIEIPYANARGAEVNQASARRFGEDLGKGLLGYLRDARENASVEGR